MSSFFDEASLVMIPSGYKDQKVYSVKPLDGSGDLTFSRASSATRVASNGLIEKVRTNLALYSQDWTNWTLFQATATANTTANPLDGAVNADTLTISTATTGVSYRSVSTGTALATFSVYLKAGTHDQASVGFTDGTDFAVNVDLTLGTITGVSSGVTGTITSVGSGWYRVTATRTISNTSTPNAFVNVIVGTVGDSVIVFGAQVELGDIATDYIATTSAAVSVGPVSGLPRLDYLNSTCPRLILEPQRSNVLTFSEQIDNAAWNKGAATITANAAVSPDGYTNADAIVDTATNAEHTVSRAANISVTALAPITSSVFLKKGTQPFAMLRSFGVAAEEYFCVVVNLETGTITKTQAGTTTTGTSATITNYGNGWYRVAATATFTGTLNNFILQLVNSATPTIGSFGDYAYLGNGTNSIFAWGFQLEQAPYATSYIPTLGTSVTRVADAASKTGISSLIGQTEGTLFAEIDLKNFDASADQIVMQLFQNSNNRIGLAMFRSGSTNSLQLFQLFSGSIEVNINTLASSGIVKIAGAYKQNDYVLYINGQQIGVDTSASVPTTSDFQLGAGASGVAPLGNGINQALLFKTRLTNAQLAELTTL
jgi:hypothetical protein